MSILIKYHNYIIYTNEHLNPHKRIQMFIELAHEDLKNSTECAVFNLRRFKYINMYDKVYYKYIFII